MKNTVTPLSELLKAYLLLGCEVESLELCKKKKFYFLFMVRIGIYVPLMNICSKQMSYLVKEVMRCNRMF